MDNPNAVYVDDSSIFVIDSHYKTRKEVNVNYPGGLHNASLYQIDDAPTPTAEITLSGESQLVVSKE